MGLRGSWLEAVRRAFSRESRISPPNIRLEASSFCQLRCPSCPTTARAIHPAIGSGYLEFADFKRLVDANPQVKTIELSNYGEIFLNPQLSRILGYAHHKGVDITILNGANLNHVRPGVLEDLVKYRVRALSCSIDGASPETYRVYRVRGDFDVVIRNIETINAFKRQYGSDYPKLKWQFVIFGHNEHEIPLARAMAEKLGMDFFAKLTWDTFSPIRDKDFVRAQTGLAALTREEHEQMHGRPYTDGLCRQLWDDPQINWDGKNLGCCRNFWGDFGGNAFADGLLATINHPKIAYARAMLKGEKPPRDDIPCTTCEMYHWMQKHSQFISDR